MSKLHRKSKVARGSIDSVKAGKAVGERRGLDILRQAEGYWTAMAAFRSERERNKNYTYGDQWGDMVCIDGERMSEEQYILRQGKVPLKNNLIRRLVRTVLGIYRSAGSEPVCTARDRAEQKLGEVMSTLLQYNMQLNRMRELNSRCMEEFLISGFVVQRKWYGWNQGQLDCWTDYVQPNNFFIDNNMRDPRGWDCTCVGEIHDIDFKELCGRFAKNDADCRRLREIYGKVANIEDLDWLWSDFGRPYDHRMADFLVPRDTGRCRVIEVWRRESKARWRCHDTNSGEIFKVEASDYGILVEAENRRRAEKGLSLGMPSEEIPLIESEWFVDSYWYYYYLTPSGEILEEGETPYEHKSHPYVFKAYPFIDGEIHSFVADVIDQQRYTNRLITMYDWIMRASAKGLLLFPEECLPKGMTIDDVADEWARFDGVIMIKQPKTGTILPQQISNNATNIGINELLNLQMKLMEDITGVNGAVQGRPGYSGMSASLYNQQTQQGQTSLLDLLESYSSFIKEGAYKDVKNMQQYYDDKRISNIVGKDGREFNNEPQSVRNVEVDLSVEEGQATPAYRAAANEFLMQIWQSGQITLEQLLETGNFPFADTLLQSIQSGGGQQGVLPQGVAPQNYDAQAVEKAQRMLSVRQAG